jgi:hypothetical protein
MVFRKGKKKMIKLSKNNLMILDAMMNQGGITKKYEDKSKRLRYSEHLGMLDFNNNGLERVIISTIPSLEYEDDPEILLPDNPIDAPDYEYIFHTHPPTPFPGARVKENVLYEFPSVNDLFHFAEHYNQGNTQGSIIIAPEGLYLLTSNKTKIELPNFDKVSNKIMKDVFDVQFKAISKYDYDYEKSTKLFYEKVAQDNSYVKEYAKIVSNYFGDQIHVMYKPRKVDKSGNWYIPSMYIPVSVIESI